MGLSKKTINIINEAVKTENINLLLKNKNEGKTIDTQITQSYLIIKKLEEFNNSFISEWINQIKPTKTQLNKYKSRRNLVKKQDKTIDQKMIQFIIDNKNSSVLHKFIYVLLNTGRRTLEIFESPYEKRGEKLYIQLRKKKDDEFSLIQLLDNNIDETMKYIKEIREAGFKYNSLSERLSRILRPFDSSPHTLRGLYCLLTVKFNKDNRGRGQVFKDSLNNASGCISNYDYITLINDTDDNPFTKDILKMTVKNLKLEAKKRKLTNYSNKNKSELIAMLS